MKRWCGRNLPCKASSNCGIFDLMRRRGLPAWRRLPLPPRVGPASRPGNAQDIARHHSQFDVGVLQELVDAIGGARPFALEFGAMAGQVPQLALRSGRHKAAAQQAVLQQLRNPLRVLDVALAAGNLFQFPRVHQQQLETPVQDVPHRLPQDSGGFHGDVRHAVGRQPVRQLPKILGHGAEGTQIRLHFPRGVDATNRRDDRFLVQVQPCDTLVNDIHDTSSYALQRLGGIERGNNLPRVLPDRRGRQLQVRGDTQARLIVGLEAPQEAGLRPRRWKSSSIIITPNFHHSRCRKAA